MTNSESLGVFQDLDTWLEMKKRALNVYTFAAFNIPVGPGVTGAQGRSYTPNATPPRTAFELHGYSIQATLIASVILAAAASGATTEASIGFVATYTQPQPPAANSTTDAATSGNLGIRNLFFSNRISSMNSNAEPATVTGVSNSAMGRLNFSKFFKEPTRFAMSQLEFYVSIFNNPNGLTYDFQALLFGKLVQVSEGEYNNLIALSSGQAVLSEVITA